MITIIPNHRLSRCGSTLGFIEDGFYTAIFHYFKNRICRTCRIPNLGLNPQVVVFCRVRTVSKHIAAGRHGGAEQILIGPKTNLILLRIDMCHESWLAKGDSQPLTLSDGIMDNSLSYVIPTETLNKIYGKLEENPLIREIDALRIPGYVSVPTASTVNDASWIAMASASTDSSDAMGTVSLTAKKLIKTIEITADIQAMSIPAFQGWLVNKLAQKMEAAICAAIVNGAGNTTVPQGVGQCGITTSTAIAGATLAKLSAFMGGLKAPYHNGAVWVMSCENFFTYVLPLASDSNGYLVQDGIGYRLLGHRVVLDDNVDNCKFKSGSTAEAANADHIIFGNFREGYVFNFGEGIQVEADNSVSFRSGSTVYRAMALCDGAVADKDAFVWTTISAS